MLSSSPFPSPSPIFSFTTGATRSAPPLPSTSSRSLRLLPFSPSLPLSYNFLASSALAFSTVLPPMTTSIWTTTLLSFPRTMPPTLPLAPLSSSIALSSLLPLLNSPRRLSLKNSLYSSAEKYFLSLESMLRTLLLLLLILLSLECDRRVQRVARRIRSHNLWLLCGGSMGSNLVRIHGGLGAHWIQHFSTNAQVR